MFKSRRKAAVPDRLLVYGDKHKSHKMELPHGTLSEVLDSVFAANPESAQSLWSISSLLTTHLLQGVVLDKCEGIKNMYLRPALQDGYALELQIDIDSARPREFAEQAYSYLLGNDGVVAPKPTAVTVDVALETPKKEELEVEVEFYVPPTRKTDSGRRWQQSEDDIFGLAGESHPDDNADHGLGIREEDLPWLNPGDFVISPRRGPCRIKKVNDDDRQVLARDENKGMLMISFDELLAEFEFDDEPK
jgi:hypothetical protein